MLGFLFNLNEREINKLRPTVEVINGLKSTVESLNDEQIRSRVLELKGSVQKQIAEVEGQADEEALDSSEESLERWERDHRRKVEREVLGEVLPEVFALVREAAKRTIGECPFDVQLMGGLVLHQGKIAEMKTGEGKTLVATLPVVLNALTGKGVHLVTVNDYLAKRDAAWMGQIYNFLGLSVAAIGHEESLLFDPQKKRELENKAKAEAEEQGLVYSSDESPLVPVTRKEAYGADITYGTNNEFGFDYLRDNMAQDSAQMVQRGLHYAIVDEVDSILIDEARTPLIISAPAAESTDQYQKFAKLVPNLEKEKDYAVDEKLKAVTLTDQGISKMEKMLGVDNIYQSGGVILVHHLEEALKAQVLFQRDRDYVVKDGEVVIVDEFTGRLMPGRRYSEGLHQAIEAKEGVEVKQESLTLATTSFQNLFRLYDKLAGMTGTAATEAEEFHKIYDLDVVEIPTNRPSQRTDFPDQVYKTELGKYKAVVADIAKRNEVGQPVLVGTVSIEKNEALSKLLKSAGIKHEVLNAKNHEREAHIIAKAGARGAVTVATNMAGRGTDIKLGEGVKELGGLHVVGTERHESRRIDNQLRGRTGRQGDPGSSQFYVSTEDDLMRIFGGDRLKSIMTTLRMPEDMPIEHGMINRAIESAQKKVEGHNFDIRKHLVEYDDVMNKHREVIYRRRRNILLSTGGLKKDILHAIEQRARVLLEMQLEGEGGLDRARDEISRILGVDLSSVVPSFEAIMNFLTRAYDQKEAAVSEETMRVIERAVYLRSIDTLWIDHLTNMERLREGIGLRGYGQYDPLVAYKQESYRMFQQLLDSIEALVTETIFRVEVARQASPIPSQMVEQGVDDSTGGAKKEPLTVKASAKKESEFDKKAEKVKQLMTDQSSNRDKPLPSKHKVGRNDPCPCGSGKKYKKCHGR